MNIGFLITARLKSSRLPRKVLLPLNGFTVIERVIQRAKQVVDPKKIVLCTSTKFQDKPLIEKATQNNINYFKGHPDDVIERLTRAAKYFGYDYILSITADNPLFSIEYAIRILDEFNKNSSLDYVFSSKLPIGLNVFGLKVNAMEVVCAIKQIVDTEIWGGFFNRPEIFNVKEINIDPEHRKEKCRLTLDESADYNVINTIFERSKKNEILNILDLYNIINKDEKILKKNLNVVQRKIDRNFQEKINEFYKVNLNKVLDLKSTIYKNNS